MSQWLTQNRFCKQQSINKPFNTSLAENLVMKILYALLPLIALSLPVKGIAERICPEGKSYRRDLCCYRTYK